MMRRFVAVLGALFLASCHGYVLQQPASSASVEVPFVPGDEEGLMTQEIILALQRSGFQVASPGRFELKLELESKHTRVLGYAYSHDDKGNLTTSLSPNEARINTRYRVSLIDKHLEEVVAGPDLLDTSVDYDHEIEEVPYNSVQASMGQLNVGSEAQIGAQSTLGRKLAKEVALWMQAARLKRLGS